MRNAADYGRARLKWRRRIQAVVLPQREKVGYKRLRRVYYAVKSLRLWRHPYLVATAQPASQKRLHLYSLRERQPASAGFDDVQLRQT